MTQQISNDIANAFLQYESHQVWIKRILSRFNIHDLRQVLPEDIERGEERLKTKNVSIVGSGEFGLIQYFLIDSNGNHYEVRRMETFVFCSCPDFLCSKSCCAHVAATFPPKCDCGKEIVIRGGQCQTCEMSQSLYYKPELPAEKVGGIRI